VWFGHGYESVLIDAGLVVALEVDPLGPHLLQDLEVSPVEGALEVLPPPPPPQSAYLTEWCGKNTCIVIPHLPILRYLRRRRLLQLRLKF